jgi:hypothetical protein
MELGAHAAGAFGLGTAWEAATAGDPVCRLLLALFVEREVGA